MVKNTLLISFILLSHFAISQEQINAYVKDHAVEIFSADMNVNDDRDLDKFSKAIGDARIVMLGEQDHGDAATFLMKSRLIKYLHDKKGFDVIAFESDFYGLTSGWDDAKAKRLDAGDFIAGNLAGIWSSCNECKGLLEYIEHSTKTARPFSVAGFDSQVYSPFAWDHLEREIDSFLVSAGIPFSSSPAYKPGFTGMLHRLTMGQLGEVTSTEDIDRFMRQLDTVVNQLSAKGKSDHQLTQTVRSVKAVVHSFLARSDYAKRMEIRDQQMADNLQWLTDVKFKGRKIIVWAASYHLIKAETDKLRHRSMGSYFMANPQHRVESYVVGFTSYKGRTTNFDRTFYNFDSPDKNSMEEWIAEKKYKYAFVDFVQFRRRHPGLKQSFTMAGIRHLQQTDNWTDFYDGVVYIQDMIPCSNY